MSDQCVERSGATCNFERNRKDIYERLDSIRAEQHQMHVVLTNQLTTLNQQMIAVLPHDIPRIRTKVAVMWGVMMSIGGIVAAIIVAALLRGILTDGG